jgi:hypothetical protein
MIADRGIFQEQAGRLCTQAQGQEISVAHEENAGYTVFGTSIGWSIMSVKGQRGKIRYGSVAVDPRFLGQSVTLSRPRQKQS